MIRERYCRIPPYNDQGRGRMPAHSDQDRGRIPTGNCKGRGRILACVIKVETLVWRRRPNSCSIHN